VEDVPPNQAHSRHFAHERGRGTSRHHGPGAEAEVFTAVSEVRRIARELGVHMAQLSIAWALSKPRIGCALVGSRSLGELRTNLAAGELILAPDFVRRLDEAGGPVLAKLGWNPDYYESAVNSRIR
jgi:aryl-alcohol dehydrogenase-like predicted oxidoreductase